MDIILFEWWGYPMTLIELTATIFGLIAVFLAVKNNTLTWPIGLLNVTLSGIIFYRIQLYSDMFLQIYFFISGCIGWYTWSGKDEALSVKTLGKKAKIVLAIALISLSLVLGGLVSNIHNYLPTIFTKPSDYPWLDTFLALTSVLANTLLALRYKENWILWIGINIISIWLYYIKGVRLISAEYLVFLILAITGYLQWRKY